MILILIKYLKEGKDNFPFLLFPPKRRLSAKLLLSNCGVGEDSWRVPWSARRSNQSILKEITLNTHWRTDAEAEASIIWPTDANSRLVGKDPDAGKDWRQKEKRAAEDEMIGWHHWFDGHELGHTPGDSEGQAGLECCSPWGHKESDTTQRLNKNNNVLPLNWNLIFKMNLISASSFRIWVSLYSFFLLTQVGFC